MAKRTLPLLFGLGVAASLAVALLSARHAAVTVHSPIRPAGAWSSAFTAAIIASFGFYVAALIAIRKSLKRRLPIIVIAALIQLLPLAAPLLLSTDVYAYWDYGRIEAVHGANPYAARPSRFADDPAYRRMGADWQDKRSVYGPVFTASSALEARIVGNSAHWAELTYRVAAALAMVLLAALCTIPAARPAFAAAFVGWNPLLALHFAGGGHNDVYVALLLIGALALGARRHRQAEGVAWATAAAVKVVPLVLLPLQLLAARRRSPGFGYAGLLGGAVTIGLLSTALYGVHWLTILTPVANQLRRPSSLGLAYWLERAGAPRRAAVDGPILIFAAAYIWLLVEAWRGRARLALTACLLLLATSWLQPWYAVWAVPLAAVEEDQFARVLAVVISAYFLRDAIPI